MAYCTQTDITARIPTLNLAQLTNDTANATTVDSTVLAALIAAADAEIDERLLRRAIHLAGEGPRENQGSLERPVTAREREADEAHRDELEREPREVERDGMVEE